MKQKLGILCYIPPPRVGKAQIFFDHIQSYKRSTALILYSDHPWPGAIKIGNPENFKSARLPDGSPNKYGTNNAAFFTGLRIAYLQGYSHVLVLEPDVRVNVDYWDMAIWDEFFDLGFPCVAAGTLAVYNPCNYSPLSAARWAELVKRNQRRNFPIATYGWMGGGRKDGSCLFPNGALAIYDMAWMRKFYDLDNTGGWMGSEQAWDMSVGMKVWNTWKEDSYLVLGHLQSIYSGYGNTVTTDEMREALLESGEVVATHQHKGEWVPKRR